MAGICNGSQTLIMLQMYLNFKENSLKKNKVKLYKHSNTVLHSAALATYFCLPQLSDLSLFVFLSIFEYIYYVYEGTRGQKKNQPTYANKPGFNVFSAVL
jgi:hypothetical protein